MDTPKRHHLTIQNDEETADETMEADDQTEIDDGNKEDVTTNEFMTSLQTVRDFLQKTGASQEIFHSITKMERIGTALKIERQSQSRITDFFQNNTFSSPFKKNIHHIASFFYCIMLPFDFLVKKPKHWI